jgi:DNA-binding MarR family transcriptional regulator
VQLPGGDEIERVRAEWTATRPDLDTTPMAVVGRVLRAEHLAAARIRRTLRRHGLDRGGFDVLATLRRGGPPHRLTPTALYERLVLTSGAMTHRVDALARARLVERVPDERDRRSTLVALTPRGLAVVDRAIEDHLATEFSMVSHLSPESRSTLAALLAELLHGMEEQP